MSAQIRGHGAEAILKQVEFSTRPLFAQQCEGGNVPGVGRTKGSHLQISGQRVVWWPRRALKFPFVIYRWLLFGTAFVPFWAA